MCFVLAVSRNIGLFVCCSLLILHEAVALAPVLEPQ